MEREKLFSVSIHDCTVETKRGHGKGGQNRNTRDTAVKITHPPSGAVGESQEQRSQLQNKKTAWKRLIESGKFRLWLNREIWILNGLPSPEQQVKETLIPANLRIEIKNSKGRWTVVDDIEEKK